MTPPGSRGDEGSRESNAEVGFPTFEHNQWTIEGEIERFGAFGHGAARAHGPRRWLAVFLVLAIVLPAVFGFLALIL